MSYEQLNAFVCEVLISAGVLNKHVLSDFQQIAHRL